MQERFFLLTLRNYSQARGRDNKCYRGKRKLTDVKPRRHHHTICTRHNQKLEISSDTQGPIISRTYRRTRFTNKHIHNDLLNLETLKESKRTIAGDWIWRSWWEEPLSVHKLGRLEKWLDGFVGRSGISKPVKPQDEGSSHGVWRRGRWW